MCEWKDKSLVLVLQRRRGGHQRRRQRAEHVVGGPARVRPLLPAPILVPTAPVPRPATTPPVVPVPVTVTVTRSGPVVAPVPLPAVAAMTPLPASAPAPAAPPAVVVLLAPMVMLTLTLPRRLAWRWGAVRLAPARGAAPMSVEVATAAASITAASTPVLCRVNIGVATSRLTSARHMWRPLAEAHRQGRFDRGRPPRGALICGAAPLAPSASHAAAPERQGGEAEAGQAVLECAADSLRDSGEDGLKVELVQQQLPDKQAHGHLLALIRAGRKLLDGDRGSMSVQHRVPHPSATHAPPCPAGTPPSRTTGCGAPPRSAGTGSPAATQQGGEVRQVNHNMAEGFTATKNATTHRSDVGRVCVLQQLPHLPRRRLQLKQAVQAAKGRTGATSVAGHPRFHVGHLQGGAIRRSAARKAQQGACQGRVSQRAEGDSLHATPVPTHVGVYLVHQLAELHHRVQALGVAGGLDVGVQDSLQVVGGGIAPLFQRLVTHHHQQTAGREGGVPRKALCVLRCVSPTQRYRGGGAVAQGGVCSRALLVVTRRWTGHTQPPTSRLCDSQQRLRARHASLEEQLPRHVTRARQLCAPLLARTSDSLARRVCASRRARVGAMRSRRGDAVLACVTG